MSDQEAEENVKIITAQHEKSLANRVRSIFILAGERNSSTFFARIENAVKESEIVKFALDLSEMLKTKFFSVCLDLYVIRPDQEFREESMDTDGNTSPESLRGHPVLCTLEIGLRDVHPQTRPRRFLLKPKVALMVSKIVFHVLLRSDSLVIAATVIVLIMRFQEGFDMICCTQKCTRLVWIPVTECVSSILKNEAHSC